MATIYVRLINQNLFKNHILFSASFYEINEEDQRSDETESFINLIINHNITENDNKDFDGKSQSEQQIQEKKESSWIFDKIDSMKIRLHKTGELDGSSYVKVLLRSNALLNINNNNKYCFLWSILAYSHPCGNDQPNRFSIYKQKFDEINIEGFDFSNEFKCSDVRKFEKLIDFSINIFALNFYQDKIRSKHNLIPIEISKKDSDQVIDL